MDHCLTCEEVHFAQDASSVVLNHTFDKTLREDSQKVVQACAIARSTLCPVAALTQYLQIAQTFGIDLALEYLFRAVTPVLIDRMPSLTWYNRFTNYLRILDIDEGETPHSLRSGLANTMTLTGAATSQAEVMEHVGWATPGVAECYLGLHVLENSPIANRLATAM